MTTIDISIIIPHRNDHIGLNRTIAALTHLVPGSPVFEVIVADNGSAGGTASVEAAVGHLALALRGPLRIISVDEIGAGPARNESAALAEGSILTFIDCDCLPRPNWLIVIKDAVSECPIVGGPVNVARIEHESSPPNAAEAFDLIFGFNVARSFQRDGLLLTANLAVKADVFRAVGPFRNGISEDMEWCHRAAGSGFSLRFVEPMAIDHVALDSEAKLFSRWRRITRETYRYRRERGLGSAGWIWHLWLVTVSPFLHARRAFMTPITPSAGLLLRIRLVVLLARIRWNRATYGLKLLRNEATL